MLRRLPVIPQGADERLQKPSPLMLLGWGSISVVFLMMRSIYPIFVARLEML
jgi:hypothetical protein